MFTMLCAIALTAGQPASSDWTAQLYDLRDLGARLPRTPDGASTSGGAPGAMGGGGSPFSNRSGRSGGGDTPPSPGDALDQLVATLTSSLGMETPTEVMEGVYLVKGASSAHASFSDLTSRVASIRDESHQVSIVAWTVSSDDAPMIGTAASPGSPEILIRQMVPVHQTVTVASEREVHVMTDLQPVVSDSAIGFDPTSTVMREGLSLDVTLHGAQEGGRQIRLVGAYTDLDLAGRSRALDAGAATMALGSPGQFVFDLPVMDVRSIDTAVTLSTSELTVGAVLDGFEGKTCIVIAVGVR